MATLSLARRSARWSSAPSTPRSMPGSRPRQYGWEEARSSFSTSRRRQRPLPPTTRCSAAPGSYGSGKPSAGVEQPSIPQGRQHRGKMRGCRAVEPFEPILIEKRGERRLAEGHLPENPEKRGRRLVLLALERRQDRSAFGRVAIDGVRSRPEPKIGEGASPGRGQREMGDLI